MQIKYVKGVDLSPGEIEEAQRRFKELKSEQKGAFTRVQSDPSGFPAAFQQLSSTAPELLAI